MTEQVTTPSPAETSTEPPLLKVENLVKYFPIKSSGVIRRTVGQYFVEGYWDGPGLHSETLPVGAYHRTLSTYVNTLAAAGLVIDEPLDGAFDGGIVRAEGRHEAHGAPRRL